MFAEAIEPFETIETWPRGKRLFREGSPSKGVYYVHSGELDLCLSSKPLFLAEAGHILGLTSILSGRTHDCSATTRSECVTGFVPKQRFLSLLDQKPELWLTVLRMVSANINACWQCMRLEARWPRHRFGIAAENANAQI